MYRRVPTGLHPEMVYFTPYKRDNNRTEEELAVRAPLHLTLHLLCRTCKNADAMLSVPATFCRRTAVHEFGKTVLQIVLH